VVAKGQQNALKWIGVINRPSRDRWRPLVLEKSEKALFEKIQETAESLIIVLDLSGTIRFFSRKAQDLTGYKAGEVVGRKWIDLFVPQEHKSDFRKLLKSLPEEGPKPRRAEYPILSKAQKEIPIAWDRTLIRDRHGKTEAVLSIGHDLTTEKTLEEEKYRTETILDSIADGVFTVNQDFRITSFNRAAAQITGFAKDEALGQYCREIFRSSACVAGCPLRQTMETGEDIIDLEENIITKENKEIPVSISAALWRDRRGIPIGGVEVFRDLSPITELKKKLKEKYSFQDIITKSKSLLEMFGILPDIAESDATVLITGESGTGKELFATALHNLSLRKKRSLVKVNCGALPETLLESELFGYKRGAFTDAKQDKPGRFKRAEGGTIFLDEIGDISQGIQVKLLRVLESKEYEPLGGTRTEKADVRIISATNRDLWSRVQSGDFREDLYYRLNVVTIDIPPIRERREDIPLLADHFVGHFNRIKGKSIAGVTQPAMEILLNHDYPGNVRELQNIIEHAFILCKTHHIGPECLPTYLSRKPALQAEDKGLHALDSLEQELIRETLARHGGRMKEAAAELGIHRATLWRKMKKLNILPHE
jgi:PAS domain S-box-containing protein